MIGYAYADLDGRLVYKVANYIENINPGFFGQNRHLIAKHWKFNTEDASSMMSMFRSLEDLRIPRPIVLEFIQSIGYNMEDLRNANKV